jgi:hypothetical protein
LEIRDLEKQLAAATAYLQALQDSLRLLPREPLAGKSGADQVLRPGSAVAKARDAILKAGKPLHISELLKILGRPVDKNSRVSLSGSLSGYAKRGEIFTRPAPNTFGLIELNHNEMPEEEPPQDFGNLPDEEPEAGEPEEQHDDPSVIDDDDVPF